LTSRRDFFKLGGAKPILNQAEDLPPLGSLSVPDRQSLKLAIAEKGKEKQMKNKIMKRTSVIVAIALAFGALDGTASASTLYAVTGTNTLLQFDSATPATITRTVAITGLLTGSERVLGIDFRPRTGQLFAVTIPTAALANGLLTTYRVNPHSGVATAIGLIPPNTVPGAANVASGFDFNPTVDRIRIVNANNENFRVNPNNGSLAGNDTDLNPGGFQVIAESYDRNWNRANATTVQTTLYGISRAASSLVLQGGLNGVPSPNGGQITTVGSLGVTVDANSDAGFDIDAGGTAYAALTVGGLTGLYSVNLTTGAATLVGTIGTGTTAVTGLAVVPRSLVVVGPGEGGNPRVRVFDAATGAQLPGALGSFLAFDPSFHGGVRVALGDVSGDGVSDIIAAAGPGGQPLVRVFDGRTGAVIRSFFAFTPSFQGGVNVAAGDVNGDGYEDVIVAAGRGNPHVRIFSGLDGAVLLSFVAYDPVFQGGVRVAAADFNLDGRAEIITAAGPAPGSQPLIRIFDATGTPFVGTISNRFFAFDQSFHGGVFVAAGDINGDGVPDVVAGADADPSFGPHVKAISGKTGAVILSFLAYSASFRGGVRVAVADVTGDSIADVVTAAGPAPGSRPLVKSFSIYEQPSGPLASFLPYPASFTGGVYVGATRR
jgi:hypothetical protein